MNRELRELFDNNHIITKKITLKNNVKIIESDEKKFVIKKRERDIKDLLKYLKSRSFSYYPEILYQTEHYDIYEYINDIEFEPQERAIDMIKLTAILHNKTTFYKEIDDNTYKELYENILDRIQYLYNYYNDIAEIIEKEEFMSPSNYYFIRNITKIYITLNYSKNQIEKWYSKKKEKKRIRIVNIHNNLKLEHYLLADKPYLISWRLSKKDLPIFDLLKLYKQYYDKLDFCDLLKIYETQYPLLKEEKILFFVLISIPDKLEFNNSELNMCKNINKFYNYLSESEKLINDYLPKEK